MLYHIPYMIYNIIHATAVPHTVSASAKPPDSARLRGPLTRCSERESHHDLNPRWPKFTCY